MAQLAIDHCLANIRERDRVDASIEKVNACAAKRTCRGASCPSCAYEMNGRDTCTM
jgi:succinate dehydrogenase/fumarate reductase-like Fe-S protein